MCPACRVAERPAAPLAIGRVTRAEDDDVIEGVLLCSQPACQCEYPIIDGIPIIVADVRAHVANQLTAIRARADLSPVTASVLGDCAGTGSEYDRERYQLSSYARSHYGDLDPELPLDPPSGLLALLEQGLARLPQPPTGMWLDAGCSVGRTAFELAARTGELVLGIDLNFSMLRMARDIARTGRVRHPLRRLGMVYDERDFTASLPARDRVEFWSCDGLALPFANSRFAGAVSVNLIDCTLSPVTHLMELGRVVAPGGHAIIATPYDWSANATPVEGWIGGHSQRSENRGESVLEMRRLLSEQAPAAIASGLTLTADVEELPWRVYVHERATMTYQVHLVVAQATRAARGSGPAKPS
ncbi:MAG: Trm112 family protein [Haliangiales bacterium]